MIKLVHLSNDSKFLDCAIEQYNLLNNIFSIYLVVSVSSKLKYVKSNNVSVKQTLDDAVDFIKRYDCDFVVVHGLFFSLSKLQKIDKPFIWCSWGFDIYSDVSRLFHKVITLSLYKPLTRAFVEKKKRCSLKQKIRNYLSSVWAEHCYSQFIKKKVKYISTVFPVEFTYIQKKYYGKGWFPFLYIRINDKVGSEAKCCGDKYILLGNSCDETNNHMDVLEKLESLKKCLNVIMPISYPEDRLAYKKMLRQYVEKLKYVKVILLDDFMPFEEYCKLISKCSFAIFGHIRQQAAGNIAQMLRMGAKVFMYKESMGYQHYTNLGCKVFSIDDDLNAEQLSNPISDNDAKKNLSIINPVNGRLRYMNNLQLFFDSLGAYEE